MSGKRNWGDNVTHRMDGKEAPAPTDGFVPVKMPSRWWKKKYKCKKNKGDHTLEIWKIVSRTWWRYVREIGWKQNGSFWGTTPYWVEWKCTACGKQEVEFTIPDKKFDRYRHTIYENQK